LTVIVIVVKAIDQINIEVFTMENMHNVVSVIVQIICPDCNKMIGPMFKDGDSLEGVEATNMYTLHQHSHYDDPNKTLRLPIFQTYTVEANGLITDYGKFI